MPGFILAIDDDQMSHKMLEFCLREQEHDVVSCFSAEEGQKVLAERATDVQAIILDWEMPVMNGIELLKWLKGKDDYKNIPVIMLTANQGDEYMKIGVDAGAYYYLGKPIEKKLLLSIVSAAINDHAKLKELQDQVQDAQNPFAKMTDGTFRIKKLDDAQKLSLFISNATPVPEQTLIISELLTNAIEHGNLGITYDEKSELVDNGTLYEEIENRLTQAKYKDREATIHFEREGDEVLIRIEDEGEGFDFNKYMEFDPERLFDNHGRGIAMVNSLLQVAYKGKGNVVEVSLNVPQV